jgi:hypothetical protein
MFGACQEITYGMVIIMIRKTLLLSLAVAVLLAGACAASPARPSPAETPVPSQPLTAAVPGQAAPPNAVREPLPEPIVAGNSVELCLNSRYSEHGLTGTASNRQMANILWAAGKAPVTGTYRDIYLATPTGEYLYEPGTHSLSRYSDQSVTDYRNFFSRVPDSSAFVINCDSNLPFDTGVAYQMAILSSVSLGKSSEPAVANCPVGTSLQFGVQEVRELTSELVARSSVPQSDPRWLPDPSTDGQNKLEEVLADLKYAGSFSLENLTLQQVSQLLWAGYGGTPHVVSGGKRGLTVPSAMAKYYLTGTIYLLNEKGVYRYQNRNPGTDPKTIDHRIEPIKATDARDELLAAVSGLPHAPCYMVICLPKIGALIPRERDFALLEAGFVAANVLIQASAIGLGCHFETNLTPDEQAGIRRLTGIPVSDTPQVIISIGGVAK